jgi:hypothetical protein
MIKNKAMKLILKEWKNFNIDLITEKVFYGSGKDSVTTTSDYFKSTSINKKPILIYDDYTVLLNKKPKSGADIALKCLSKDYVSGDESEVTNYILDFLEEIFGDFNQEELDIVNDRISLYKERFGSSIFSDNRLVVFNPFAQFKEDDISISQTPRVRKDLPDTEVDYDISAKDLSGEDKFLLRKSDYPNTYPDDTDEDFEIEQEYDIRSVKQNVNWTVHDLAHNIFEGAFENNDSEIDYMSGNELKNSDIFKKIYPVIDRDVRAFDRFYKKIKHSNANNRSYFDLTSLVNDLTPGVGKGDVEFSLFAKLIKDESSDRVEKLVEEIVTYVSSNKKEIDTKIISYFNLEESEVNLKNYLLEIFNNQDKVAKRFFDNVKIVFV